MVNYNNCCANNKRTERILDFLLNDSTQLFILICPLIIFRVELQLFDKTRQAKKHKF